MIESLLVLATVLSASPEKKCECPKDQEKEPRFWAGAETGWNATTGLGVMAGFNPCFGFGLDVGVGAGLTKPRFGTRIRLQPFDSVVSPFLGAGFVFIPAQREKRRLVIGEGTVDVEHDDLAIPQVMVGATFRPRNRFFGTAAVGWAFSDPHSSAFRITGRPKAVEEAGYVVGGGLLLSFAAGMQFGSFW